MRVRAVRPTQQIGRELAPGIQPRQTPADIAAQRNAVATDGGPHPCGAQLCSTAAGGRAAAHAARVGLLPTLFLWALWLAAFQHAHLVDLLTMPNAVIRHREGATLHTIFGQHDTVQRLCNRPLCMRIVSEHRANTMKPWFWIIW